MKRKLFTFCAFVSLLLGAATVWWWVGSRTRIDQLTFETNGSHSVRLWGWGGKLMLTRTVLPPSAKSGSGEISWSRTPCNPNDATAGGNSNVMLTSFSYANQPLPNKPGGSESSLVIPAWLLVLVFALLPALWVAMKMKPKKKQSHG